MGNFTGGERGVDGQTREDLAGVHAHHTNLVNARDGGFKLEQDAVLVEGRALLHGDAAGAGRAALEVKSAPDGLTSLLYLSRKISLRTPGSPARHWSRPDRSNVVAATMGSAASTNTATSLCCEPDCSATAHRPDTVLTPVTS